MKASPRGSALTAPPEIPRPGAKLREVQLEVVADLAMRHLELDIMSDDYSRSADERLVERWIHQPMAAALDLLNAYAGVEPKAGSAETDEVLPIQTKQ